VKDFFPPIRQPRRRLLTDDEIALWVEVTRHVAPRPGKAAPRIATPPPEPPPPAPNAAPPRPALPPYSPPPQFQPTIPPLARLERRLKQNLLRGRTQVDGVIDLHGLRQHEAHHALIRFLLNAQARHDRVVLVVTGKGLGKTQIEDGLMREPGVLRRAVPQWLSAPELRAIVTGYEEAAQTHGGAGALYVRLRRADRASRGELPR